VVADGGGTVYSYAIVHQALRGVALDVPYVVAIIELAEGPHLVSNVVGVPVERVEVGMPVRVFFEKVTETISLAKFRPTEV